MSTDPQGEPIDLCAKTPHLIPAFVGLRVRAGKSFAEQGDSLWAEHALSEESDHLFRCPVLAEVDGSRMVTRSHARGPPSSIARVVGEAPAALPVHA